MATGIPPRKYTWAVILLGVAGAFLVPLWVWLFNTKIEDLTRVELRDVAERHAAFLHREMDRARRRVESDGFGPRDPQESSTWRDAAPILEDGLSALPGFEGLEIRHDDWRQPIGHPIGLDAATRPAGPSAGGVTWRPAGEDRIVIDFHFPRRAAPEDRVTVQALIMPWSLGPSRWLFGLATYGAVAVGVSLYLLGAVIILVNRAQIRLISKEREKAIRLLAMGDVAGGIAHEVRNPLNAVSLSVQYMEKLFEKSGRSPAPADYARIHLELGKIRKVVDNFVKFARMRDMEAGPMDLGSVIDDVLARLEKEPGAAGIRIEVSKEGDLGCIGDREKIAEVFHAVGRNAIDAMKDRGGELRIRAAGSRRTIRTTIRDTGEVVDDQVLRNIFVPYFTTRESAIGLGMTMARTFVESHGGTIEAAKAQGGGCVVTIVLPRRGR